MQKQMHGAALILASLGVVEENSKVRLDLFIDVRHGFFSMFLA